MLTPKPTVGDTSWFVRDRFGMFIHWGLYALPARHEWIRNREFIDNETYEKYFKHFDPDLYDPKIWAKAAAQAGMKYFIITTKHHEGFCLWDSAYTDYKSTKTPYGKDLLTPMVNAFRDEGIKVGFYHSLIDWHHPDFPVDFIHPLRNRPDWQELNKSRDVAKYAEYLHNQVEELLTQFGQIDIIWFDFSYNRTENGMPGKNRDDWQSEKLIEKIRKLQPNVIINDRLDLPDVGDIKTPEQYQPHKWICNDKGEPVVWEACQTFSGSWGYHRDESTWKSPEQLLQLLINSVSLGGNLLMNVGPTGRGEFDQRALDALKVYADWMHLHSKSIYNCTMSEFTAPKDCRYTQNGKKLYLHVYAWPYRNIFCPGLSGKVEYIQLLNDASEIKFKDLGIEKDRAWAQPESADDSNAVLLELPIIKPNVTIPVIEIFLK